MLALVPALLLAACGGSGDSASSSQDARASKAASDRPVTDSANFDAAIEENPCELASADMVAALFEVPVSELERESSISSACVYRLENAAATERLDVMGIVSDVEMADQRAGSNFHALHRGQQGTRTT